MELLGVDIGGTKITAGLIKHGQVVNSITVSTEPEKSREHIANNLFKAIDSVITNDTQSIGLGIPGIIDQLNGIIYEPANIASWRNFELKDELIKKYPIPIYLDNDANCFVKGSVQFGIALEYNHVVGLTLGTGLGTGIISKGSIVNGAYNGAGEFGQIPYFDSIYENYCSGQFFAQKNEKGEDLYLRALAGDQKALDLWNEFGKHMGAMISNILYSVAPEAIVFGGSVSKGFEFFLPAIKDIVEKLKIRSVADHLNLLLEKNKDIAVLGAAALYLE